MGDSTNMLRLGLLIRSKRSKEEWGLRETCQQVGISASTLSRLERGIGSPLNSATITKLSDWLGVSVVDLLFGEQNELNQLKGLSTLEVVTLSVRADKRLSSDVADALIHLFHSAYTLLAQKGE